MPIDITLIKYFTVKWTIAASILDGVDIDDTPDLEYLSGIVVFTPNLSRGQVLKFQNIPDPFTVVPIARSVTVLAGQLVNQGIQYVKLESGTNPNASPLGWNWNVDFNFTYKGKAVSIKSTVINGDPDTTQDLSDYMLATDATSGVDMVRGPRGYDVASATIVGNDKLRFGLNSDPVIYVPDVTIPQFTEAFIAASDAVAAAISASDTAVAVNQSAIDASAAATTATADAVAAAGYASDAEADAATVTTLAAQVTTDAATVTTDAAQVSTDAAQVAADSAQVATDKDAVTTLAAVAGASATLAVTAAEEAFTVVSAQSDWTGSVSFTSIEVDSSAWYKRRLTGNTTLTVPAGTNNRAYTVTLEVTQDAVGGKTLAFVGVSWPYGLAPILTTLPNFTDILFLTWNGNRWLGSVGMQGLS